MTGIKQKTIAGLKWSAAERFSSQGVRFVISIFIARMLSPADYGIIGMIMIFIEISGVFVSGGFGAALIRKQDRSDTDLSTVFYYNIAISIFFYLLLFITAPYIASFYGNSILIPVIRVVGLNVIIGAFGAIQSTILNIRIDFKTQTKISLITLVISGTIGITMALISTILLWVFIKWQPKLIFSGNSFRELFGFGSKLMLSGLIDATYNNIYQVIIGKMFTSADLGFFTRAKLLAQQPSSNITGVIQRVTFPVLSEMQNNLPQLESNYRKLLKMSAFVIFPLMLLLGALSEPLIKILLTDKWLPAVPLLQVLCIAYMFYPVHAINLNLLQVKGRSDLFLKLEIIKKMITTIILFVTAPLGVLAMCVGIVVSSLISLVINTHYTGKLINIGFFDQLRDIMPILILSIVSGVAAYAPSFVIEESYFRLATGGILGGFCFFTGSYLFCKNELKLLKSFITK
ncbi:MAG: polysaccharide biosynthesis [Prolixibacteraceae bacterium]|nr:MAG: polysaccharide biosynthesis [Prolixibacteraceae bacterium]